MHAQPARPTQPSIAVKPLVDNRLCLTRRVSQLAASSDLGHDSLDHSSRWTGTSVSGRSSALVSLPALNHAGTDHVPLRRMQTDLRSVYCTVLCHF
jgi:hypothetical protein